MVRNENFDFERNVYNQEKIEVFHKICLIAMYPNSDLTVLDQFVSYVVSKAVQSGPKSFQKSSV